MKAQVIRQKFIDYFAKHDHQIVSSSSLVPADDPTLLFTNAGMVQFKDVFLGKEKRDYQRAVSVQRCVRAGGKHNDLENVGYTARHHTLFEMMGNFSFGDYFKEQAIRYAWDFLTQEIGLDPKKLWVTVYQDDQQAEDIWLKTIKIDPKRFSRCGEKDNFWSMGETGPCGPCTEIFYDHGSELAGDPPGQGEEGDRYVEIWNLVFMQYNRDESGQLTPLPKPSVDTGMGIERLAAVLQGVHNNFDTDLFQGIIQAVLKQTPKSTAENPSVRVIADHIRSCAFLIVDGVRPSNEGRGYVLRRIIRRAVRHGHQLGCTQGFFAQLVEPLVLEMGQAYPELKKSQAVVKEVLHHEEVQFSKTLAQGLQQLNQAIEATSNSSLSGEIAFKLYDTFGFPVDLTQDILKAHQMTIDMAGFEEHMQRQRAQSKSSEHFAMKQEDDWDQNLSSDFVGYDHLQQTAAIKKIVVEGQQVTQLKSGQAAQVVLDQTPFYAESGGQVGDKGALEQGDAIFNVAKTIKKHQSIVHIGVMKQGTLSQDKTVKAIVDQEARAKTALNHSATHLLHAALRQVLGTHVLQKGSLVAPDRLRFDFSHFSPVTVDQIREIEQVVNREILKNTASEVLHLPLEQALATGAIALFDEKYADEVRVLKMGGDFSVELCGGTHVGRSGDIGFFKIIAETGIASGVRRIEALTGLGALTWAQGLQAQFSQMANELKTTPEQLPDKLQQLLTEKRQLEKQLQKFQQQQASGIKDQLLKNVEQVAGVSLLVAECPNAPAKQLRGLLDMLKQKIGSGVIVLASVNDGRVALIAGVTDDLSDRYQAGKLVNHVATQVGGKGGGRKDMAQAGGTEPENLKSALDSVKAWLES